MRREREREEDPVGGLIREAMEEMKERWHWVLLWLKKRDEDEAS